MLAALMFNHAVVRPRVEVLKVEGELIRNHGSRIILVLRNSGLRAWKGSVSVELGDNRYETRVTVPGRSRKTTSIEVKWPEESGQSA